MALKVKAVERLLTFTNKENDPDGTGSYLLHGVLSEREMIALIVK